MTSYRIGNFQAWIARPRIDRRLELLAFALSVSDECRTAPARLPGAKQPFKLARPQAACAA
jgi:hypothetical protein